MPLLSELGWLGFNEIFGSVYLNSGLSPKHPAHLINPSSDKEARGAWYYKDLLNRNIHLRIYPKHPTHPINPSSDKEARDGWDYKDLLDRNIYLCIYPKHPTHPINPSSDEGARGMAEVSSPSKFLIFKPMKLQFWSTKIY